MKTKEELNALKEEVETLNKKLAELTDEELKMVTGGKDQEDEERRGPNHCDGKNYPERYNGCPNKNRRKQFHNCDSTCPLYNL